MRIIKRVVLLAAILLGCVPAWGADDGLDNVLLWWVKDPDTEPFIVKDFDGSTSMIKDLVGRGDAAGKTVNAVRVMALTGDTSTQLKLMMPESNVWSDYIGLPDGEGDFYAGPAYANFTGVAGNADLSFMIELGNLNGDSWTTLAVSEIAAVESLGNFIRSAQLNMYGLLEWTPSYTVPEPTSGLLVLLGCGLLALRRRQKVVA